MRLLLASLILVSCSSILPKTTREQTEIDYINKIDNPFRAGTDRYYAWLNGYTSHEKGCDPGENPYDDKWNFMAWNEGYLKAKEHYDENIQGYFKR